MKKILPSPLSFKNIKYNNKFKFAITIKCFFLFDNQLKFIRFSPIYSIIIYLKGRKEKILPVRYHSSKI
jgi:hypothetical protein